MNLLPLQHDPWLVQPELQEGNIIGERGGDLDSARVQQVGCEVVERCKKMGVVARITI